MDQYSGLKNKFLDQYCKSEGINHIFCSVGDHQRCALVERTIQTVKRKLGTLQLEEKPPDIHTALKMIIEDIRITKNSVAEISPFELHFGMKPDSECSLATDNLKCKVFFHEQNWERDLLTGEDKREVRDCRPRVKVVKNCHQYRDVSPKFKMETTQIANTPYYKSLERLAKSANE